MSNYDPVLPPVPLEVTRFSAVRQRLLRLLRGADPVTGEPTPLTGLEDAADDWVPRLAEAWATLADIFAFYQERIVNEAFLPTGRRPESRTLLFTSLGHRFPPLTAASTVLTYTVSDAVAGIDAVTRNRANGAGTTVAGQLRPPAPLGAGPSAGVQAVVPGGAQVRGIPSAPDQRPPTFSTIGDLAAVPGATGVTVWVDQPANPGLPLTATLVTVRGTHTGAALGQPIVITGRDPTTGRWLRWVRELTTVAPNPAQGLTHLGWEETLDGGAGPNTVAGTPGSPPASAGAALPAAVTDGSVEVFTRATPMAGHTAKPWGARSPADRLATPAVGGGPVPTTGGLLRSRDRGLSWHPAMPGLPAGATVVGAFEDGPLLLVATANAGLYRATGGALTAVRLSGKPRLVCLAGHAGRLLLGTTNGVLVSLDAGETWEKVTGSPPVSMQVPAKLDPGASSPPKSPTTVIVDHQLPPVPVRALLEAPDGALLAGTDRGAYRYDGRDWSPDGLDAPVTALMANQGTEVLAGTAAGVYRRVATLGATYWVPFDTGGTPWQRSDGTAGGLGSAGPGKPEAVHALIAPQPLLAAGTILAGTDSGLWCWPFLAAMSPFAPGLPAAPVRSLVATATELLAGTDEGLYRAGDGASWQRCDDLVLFTLGPGAVPGPSPPPPGGPVPLALAQAFSDVGMPLGAQATLTAHGPDWDLADGGTTYHLARTPGGTEVRVPGGFSTVGMLAATGASLLAGGDPLTSAARDWPGQPVIGHHVEVSSLVRDLVPGMPVVLADAGEHKASLFANVTDAAQVILSRFGATSAVTRLGLDLDVGPAGLNRLSTSVWSRGSTFTLVSASPPQATTLVGAAIALVSALPAPVVGKRLAVVSGRPPRVALAPLGGLLQVVGNTTQPVGPAEVDATAVALDPAGTVYLAAQEGVFRVCSGGRDSTLLADGWPSGPATALLVLADGSVLAGTSDGARLLGPGACSWAPAGLAGAPVSALAMGGTQLVAVAGGTVFLADAGVLTGPVPAPPPAGSSPGRDPASPPAASSDGPAPAAPPSESSPASPSESSPAAVSPGSGPASPGAPSGPVAVAWAPLGVPEGSVNAIAVVGGVVVAATSARVQAWSNADGWRPVPQGPPEPVTHLAADPADPSGGLWAAVGGRLWRSADAAMTWLEAAGDLGRPIDALASDGRGSVIAATTAGLHRLDARGRWIPGTISTAAAVAAIVAGPNGAVWLAARAVARVVPPDGPPAELAHTEVLTGHPVTRREVAMLDQGVVPPDLAEVLAARRAPLGPAASVVVHRPGSCWSIVGGTTAYVVALRGLAGAMAVSVWRNGAVADLLTPAAGTGVATVATGDVIGSLEVRDGAQILLPARAGAPALVETVAVTSVDAGPAGGPAAVVHLDGPMAHCYDGATATVSLNAVRALHGHRVDERLGSGDPTVANQTFTVTGPIAAVPDRLGDHGGSLAATSSLTVTVDGLPWAQVDDFRMSGPTDRVYLVHMAANGSARITFGDGTFGARLPAGAYNVSAHYLKGGGSAGGTGSGALAHALTRPQMVTGVSNPLPAPAPPTVPDLTSALAVSRPLGRAVTLSDYEDLVAANPGVLAASATRLTDRLGNEVVVCLWASPDAPADLAAQITPAVVAAGQPGVRFRIIPCTAVPIHTTLEISVEPHAGDVTGLVAGLVGSLWEGPGLALTAAHVVNAATSAAGVVAARLVEWSRPGGRAVATPSLAAAPTRRDPHTGRLLGAELLFVDPAALELRIITATPVGDAPGMAAW